MSLRPGRGMIRTTIAGLFCSADSITRRIYGRQPTSMGLQPLRSGQEPKHWLPVAQESFELHLRRAASLRGRPLLIADFSTDSWISPMQHGPWQLISPAIWRRHVQHVHKSAKRDNAISRLACIARAAWVRIQSAIWKCPVAGAVGPHQQRKNCYEQNLSHVVG